MTLTVAALSVKVSAEGADEAKDKIKGVGDQTDETGGILAKFAGAAVAFEVVKGAGELLAGQIEDISRVTGEHEKVQGQLQAVLKSTGDVSGVTAGMVDQLAASLSQQTTYSADAVTGVDNLLLTFTGIGKDVMPQATRAVLDMSTALGQDTKSSAIQLGKALDDPVKGITALHRVGVDFNDSQKALIKTMEKSGNLAGAQAIILKELQKEFGGSAVAAGKTLPGELAILHNKMEEVQIHIAEKVSPVIADLTNTYLAPLVDKISTGVNYVLDHGTEIWKQYGGIITVAGGIIGGLLVGALIAATVALWAFVAPIIAASLPFLAVGVAIGAVIAVVALLITHWSDLTAWFSKSDFGKGVIGVFNDIKDVITTIIGKIGDLLGSLGKIKDAIGGGLGKIGGLLGHIPGFAAGTDSAPGGLAIVGESGPELVNLPQGAQVVPLASLGSGGSSGGFSGTQIIRVELDRRTIAEVAVQGLPREVRLATGLRL